MVPAQLVAGAQVERLRGRGRSVRPEQPLEIPAVEQPLPAHSPARELAGARQRLDPLGVEVEIAGGLLGTQVVP